MPESAIANVEVDHVLPLADIGPLLRDQIDQPRPAAAANCNVEEEPDAMGIASEQNQGNRALPGEPSGLTCPECGGSLFEKKGEQPVHFRCRTGHAYSPESLLAKQSESLEAALWAALRALEENAALARRMEKRVRGKGQLGAGQRYERRALDADQHAETLRSILKQGGAELA
jgi:two-component system chemotaxis response regulator CheB